MSRSNSSRLVPALLLALMYIWLALVVEFVQNSPERVLSLDETPAFDLPTVSLPTKLAPIAPVAKPAAIPPAPKIGGNCDRYIGRVSAVATEVFGLDPPVARLVAQLQQESACRTTAISSAGARGIAQFMPATAALMARKHPELAPADPHSDVWAIRAQQYLMRDLLAIYNDKSASACDQWLFAFSAYNGGERTLANEKRKALNPASWFGAAAVRPQRARSMPAWRENRGYIDAILRRERDLIAAGINGSAVCA